MSQHTNNLMKLAEQRKGALQAVAPQWLSVDRVMKLALAATSRSPMLAQCSPQSFLLFCMRCAETGLEPIGAGGAWPVPFRNRKNNTVEVQFIPDWRGLIFLAKKSGMITHCYGDVVCDNDEFSIEKGDAPKCTHKPSIRSRGDVIGAYAIISLPDGDKHIEWMTREEIDAIRARSKASDNGPWVTDYGQMAVKTVVKRALKPFAGSPQLHKALDYDNEATGLAPSPERAPIVMPEPIMLDAEAKDDTTELQHISGTLDKVSADSVTIDGKDYRVDKKAAAGAKTITGKYVNACLKGGLVASIEADPTAEEG